MNKQKPRTFKFFTKTDALILLVVGTIAAILNLNGNPFLAATAIMCGIVLARLLEYQENQRKATPEPKPNTEPTKGVNDAESRGLDGPYEDRSANQIITDKLDNGIIERAIDKRFDKMVTDIVDDLFGNYGDISREIKGKLRDTMNERIEAYDFSQHTTKLEHLLNHMVTGMTAEQDRIVQNARLLLGIEPIKTFKTSELFDKFAAYAAEQIDVSTLDVNTDDTPSYENLTVRMESQEERTFGSDYERRAFKFTCEEDESMQVTVNIARWVNHRDDNWHIDGIITPQDSEQVFIRRAMKDESDLTTLETPVTNLRELTEMHAFLLKLYYERTAIIIDEVDMLDEDVEVDEEPEATF